MSVAKSTDLPIVPRPPVSVSVLAESLAELWRVFDATEEAILNLAEKHPDCVRGECQMRAMEDRAAAVEDLLLETPAQTLGDAIAQLIVLLPKFTEKFDCPSTGRTMAGALRVLLKLSKDDFSPLLRSYARHMLAFNVD